MIITDPATGLAASVSDSNRLGVTAVSISAIQAQARRSRAWNVTTALTLTSAALQPLFYYLNTGTREVLIELLALNTGISTGGSGNGNMRIVRNPTAGTLVSAGTTLTGINRNFGSTNPPGATIRGAASFGQTLTDGDTFLDSDISSGSRNLVLLGGSIVVPPGASFGISVQAPTGNTSMLATLGVALFNPIDNTLV